MNPPPILGYAERICYECRKKLGVKITEQSKTKERKQEFQPIHIPKTEIQSPDGLRRRKKS